MQMAVSSPQNFVTWNSGSPLIPLAPPNHWDPISVSALKALPKFTREDSKILVKHLQDVADVCTIHNVT